MEHAEVKEEYEMENQTGGDSEQTSLTMSSLESSVIEDSNCDKLGGNEELLHPSNVPCHQKQKISLAQSHEESKEINEEGKCLQEIEEHHLDSFEVENLRKQLEQSAIVQSASEQVIAELQAAVSNAEYKAEQTLMELAEAKKKFEEDAQTKDRKYTELDAKLTKLQKRAKQRIQEVQKVNNELTDKMMEMEKSHGSLISDSISKHQKLVADLEAQLGDAIQERMKSAESVSSLQAELAKKESQIAEMDAASSGELIRLMAALDATKAEMTRMKEEHGKEQKNWEMTLKGTKIKLEEAEKTHLQHEFFAAKAKSQLESELQGLQQSLSLAQAESLACKEQVNFLEKEFSAYKVRAHSLLQKKEAELSAAKDTEKLALREAALKEAQNKAAEAGAERDDAVKALKEATAMQETQLAARTTALMDAQQKIRELATNLESSKSKMLVGEEEWQNRLDNVTRAWQEKYNLLVEKNASKIVLEQELTLLKDKFAQSEEEVSLFKGMANKMLESKDQEIARLLEELRDLQKIMSDSPKVSREDPTKSSRDFEENSMSAGEQQILMLARQQAQREEEVSQCQRHIQALQDEIVELEHENRLHSQQEAALKEELRNLDRSRKREGVDMTYLKNVILKLLETGEVEALLPVVATLLQFSRDELKKCQEVYNVVPETPAANGPTTLLSRFLFSKSGK